MVNRYFDQTVSFATTDGATKYSFNVAYDEESGARRYRIRQRPSNDGDPDRPFAAEFPFGYMGMGSFQARRFEDTHGEADSIETRYFNRLYPGLARTAITLTVTPDATIRALWIAYDSGRTPYLYVGGGTKVRKVRISDNTDIDGVTLANTGYILGPPANWGGYWWLGNTGSPGYRLTVGIGAGTDTWTAMNVGGAVEATVFTTAVLTGSTTPVLVRGDWYGRIATASADPTQLANWSAVYPIAPQTMSVMGMVTHDNNIYVGTMSGLYVVDPNVNGTPLTGELSNGASVTSGTNTTVWHGKVYYPTPSGIFRARGGSVRTVGIETLPSGPGYQGRPTALAGSPNWLYAGYSVYQSGAYYGHIYMAREREPGEPAGASELVWHGMFIYETGEVGAMCYYPGDGTNNPRLFYSTGTTLKYVTLATNGGFDPDSSGLTYKASGTWVAGRNDNGRPDTLKVAEVIEVAVRNVGTATWSFAFGWDSAAVANVANATTNGWQRLAITKGTNDSGRILQLTVGLANGSTSSPSYLDGGKVVVRGRERPDQVREVTVAVVMTEGGMEIPQGKTVQELRDQLFSWRELGTALTFTDNFTGETFTCRIQDVEAVETNSDVGNYPASQVSVRLVESLN